MKAVFIKKFGLSVILTLGIILIFALADYFFHQLSGEYSVPPRYFPNKIIYGTIIGLVTFWLLAGVRRPWLKSLIFSGVIAILLQVRYFFEGYPLDFVVLFLFIHFAILWLVSFAVFKWRLI
ncbi:MAG: hypothetical protein A3A24_03775 [Candidatus Buchananbacteria bacterium RIFCSPLOWO2_01_FULL_46_12]|uniref:Uncharacterized protein n=2 Tax=Candidatus Buchananiibacteriota TaxID=1817903 RepID=A0A1G1YNK2_9BACT|nr:MAG: hypothetical protein A2744_03770 [Candidatus Buchananbacteria bacterium RIFCSPHIGHO2_01_FULL_44_11]OGY53869.1 MAG: hypothetical protein A3A24_03775 [Candidatus Buchananbacteria bacterium RIFCSPLOWO2_01_FULL_46_12]